MELCRTEKHYCTPFTCTEERKLLFLQKSHAKLLCKCHLPLMNSSGDTGIQIVFEILQSLGGHPREFSKQIPAGECCVVYNANGSDVECTHYVVSAN